MNHMSPFSAGSLAVPCLLLRLMLGVLLFYAGLGKFLGGYGNFTNYMITEFTTKTWLPALLLYPFTYTLPFVEIVLGLLILVGLFARPALLLSGLLFITLMFGKMLVQDSSTVSALANYCLITAATYVLTVGDRYSLDVVLGKRSVR